MSRHEAQQFFGSAPQHRMIFLNIKSYQQTKDYTCGAAVIMSLMKYYNMLDEHQMNAETEKRITKELGTTVSEGTNEYQLARWLKAHGFKVILGFNGNRQLILKYLRKQTPVIVDWIDWGGHWVIVAGYDEALLPHHDETIFLADPAARYDHVKSKDGIIAFDADRFFSMWFNSKLKPTIYIVAIPITPQDGF